MVNELAYYIRLSLADEETGKVKDESESISNQRALILKYISDHPEFDGWKVHEFVDDGYSGTNGDRPDFQRMIERVHEGSIQCIISELHLTFSYRFLFSFPINSKATGCIKYRWPCCLT